MRTGVGSMCRVMQVGSGVSSGMVTDDSETFSLENLGV